MFIKEYILGNACTLADPAFQPRFLHRKLETLEFPRSSYRPRRPIYALSYLRRLTPIKNHTPCVFFVEFKQMFVPKTSSLTAAIVPTLFVLPLIILLIRNHYLRKTQITILAMESQKLSDDTHNKLHTLLTGERIYMMEHNDQTLAEVRIMESTINSLFPKLQPTQVACYGIAQPDPEVCFDKFDSYFGYSKDHIKAGICRRAFLAELALKYNSRAHKAHAFIVIFSSFILLMLSLSISGFTSVFLSKLAMGLANKNVEVINKNNQKIIILATLITSLIFVLIAAIVSIVLGYITAKKQTLQNINQDQLYQFSVEPIHSTMGLSHMYCVQADSILQTTTKEQFEFDYATLISEHTVFGPLMMLDKEKMLFCNDYGIKQANGLHRTSTLQNIIKDFSQKLQEKSPQHEQASLMLDTHHTLAARYDIEQKTPIGLTFTDTLEYANSYFFQSGGGGPAALLTGLYHAGKGLKSLNCTCFVNKGKLRGGCCNADRANNNIVYADTSELNDQL